MELNIQNAELALREAAESNPGAWVDHSRFVAEACKNIASHCKDLSSEQAYIFGLLHDIGRYAGVSSERHLIDGYRYCMERGWEKAAQICISHAFMIQDIDTSIGVFDVSDEDYLFMKEFVANVFVPALVAGGSSRSIKARPRPCSPPALALFLWQAGKWRCHNRS